MRRISRTARICCARSSAIRDSRKTGKGWCLAALLCLCVMAMAFTEAVAAEENPSREWSFPVVVLPPKSGWESDEGKSAWLALKVVMEEANATRDGVAGRDVLFLKSQLPTPKDAPAAVDEWRKNGVKVVISLADSETDKLLVSATAADDMPLLLANGEWVSLSEENGRPFKNVFALDLYYPFRAVALAKYAAFRYKGATVAIEADLNDGQMYPTYDLLQRKLKECGLTTMTIWHNPARRVPLAEDEASSAGATILISCLGPRNLQTTWRRVKEKHLPLEVWYSGPFLPSVPLSLEGLLVADQAHLATRGESFDELAARAWEAERKKVTDRYYAVKARAAGLCAVEALKISGGKSVADAMSGVSGIPLGDELLDIDKTTHRPASRKVALLRVSEKGLALEHIVEVRSSEVPDSIGPYTGR